MWVCVSVCVCVCVFVCARVCVCVCEYKFTDLSSKINYF